MIRRRDVNLSTADLRLGTHATINTAAKDFIHGSGAEEIRNIKGAKVSLEGVVVQSYAADPFVLSVLIGGQWYDLGSIKPSHPLIEALRETKGWKEIGPSQGEIERQFRREQDQQEAIEASRIHALDRARIINERKERELRKRNI